MKDARISLCHLAGLCCAPGFAVEGWVCHGALLEGASTRGSLIVIKGHPAATGLLGLCEGRQQVRLRQRVKGLLRWDLHGL